MKLTNVLFLVGAIGAISASEAAVYRGGDTVMLAESDTLSENYIATGETVMINGEVHGDMLAACRNYDQRGDVWDNLFLACQHAEIGGNTNDILVFAQDVEVRSDTTGDVRGAAQIFSIHGYLGGDLVAGAQSVYVGPEAVIAGDVLAGAARVTILGEVNGSLIGGAETLTIGGRIHGDVDVRADEILFTGEGEILGDLTYHAEQESQIDYADHVRGVVRFEPEVEKAGSETVSFLFRLFLLISAVVTSLLLVLVWRRGMVESLRSMERHTGGSILAGLLGFAALPVVAVLLIVLLITAPAGVMLLLIYPVLMYLGWVICGVWLGKTLLDGLLRRDVSLWAAAPLGTLLLGILAYVPFLGWIIALLTMILGIGMVLVRFYASRGEPAV